MADTQTRKGNLFIVYRDSLLAGGLESLLKSGGIAAVQIDLRRADAWSKLQNKLQPGDVIIVDKRDAQVHPSLSIVRLLMNNPNISIIGMDPQENGLELYRRQPKAVTEPEDLVKLIDRCRSVEAA